MERLLCTVILSCICGCILAEDNIYEQQLNTNFDTHYPNYKTDLSGMFMDDRAQVKLGYPDVNGAKIWTKGSHEFNLVQLLLDQNQVIYSQSLSPPHYVHLFEKLENNQNYKVKFISHDEEIVETITTNSLSEIVNPGDSYSIAFYGCFQPFTVNKRTYESSIFTTANDFPKRFLRTFSNVITQRGSTEVNSLLPNTKLLIGTGDQVYMDAGYATVAADGVVPHPLSAWTTTKFQSQLLRTEDGYKDHVEKTYRAFGSIVDMNTIQKNISQVSAWDDHEIRDGWGSQEDEYKIDNITLTEKFRHAFMAAKKGYVDHQLLTGPRSSDASLLIDNLSTMEQTFSVGKYKGITLDLRTSRNIQVPRVMGQEQKQYFKKWLKDEVNDGDPIIIISTMPIFLANYPIVEKIANKSNSDSKDDVNDGWASKKNNKERREILSMLLDARINRDVKPIFVSGDYHKGAISEIWYGESGDCDKDGEINKKVFGYELLASGVYHEGIVDDYEAFAFNKIESQRLGAHFINELGSDNLDKKYCLDPFVSMSIVQENFGGLEVIPDGDDLLKLVTGDGKNNEAYVFQLPLKWNKPFIPENEKAYVTIYQKATKYFGWLFNVDSFAPKMPYNYKIKLEDI